MQYCFLLWVLLVAFPSIVFASSESDDFFKDIDSTLNQKIDAHLNSQAKIEPPVSVVPSPLPPTAPAAPTAPTAAATAQVASHDVEPTPVSAVQASATPPQTDVKSGRKKALKKPHKKSLAQVSTVSKMPIPEHLNRHRREYLDFRSTIGRGDMPYIEERRVYDYRNQIPSPQVSKMAYGPNNQHLPKAFYQNEYSQYLFLAVNSGDISSIRTFLERRADINAQDARNGYTPLMYSIQNKNERTYDYLILKGADVNLQANDGKTALHMAVLLGDINAISALINGGADYRIVDNDNKTPLQYDTKYKEFLTLLIAKHFRDPDAAIVYFAKINSLYALRYALYKGANPNAQDDSGDTPLIFATRNRNKEMVELLLSKGASPSAKNKHCDMPITIAKRDNDRDIYTLLMTFLIKHEIQGLNIETYSASPIDSELDDILHRVGSAGYDASTYPSMGVLGSLPSASGNFEDGKCSIPPLTSTIGNKPKASLPY